MLFNCSLLATGLCNLTNVPYDISGNVVSSYQYSKWKISNCTPEQTQIVITNLDWMGQSLPLVNQALQLSTNTAPYKIFFKSNRELPLIQRVFNSMTSGEEVEVDSESHTLHSAPPEFFCVTSNDFTDRFLDVCAKEDLDASMFKDEPFIMLCPRFWDSLWPAIDGNMTVPTCPDLTGGSLLPENDWMLESKMAIMIHELSHLYTPNQIVPELYTMRDCAALSAAKAARNANNYTFFAMSKLSVLLTVSEINASVGVIMGCTQWPAGLKRSYPGNTPYMSKNMSRDLVSRDKFNTKASGLLSTLRRSGR